MAGHKDLPAGLGAHQIRASLFTVRQQAQLRAGQHILPANAGVAGMGGVEHLVKAAHQRVRGPGDLVQEHAEHLLVQQLLADAEMVVQRGLRAPAHVQGGVHVGLAEFQNPAQLVPVIHLFKGHGLHRRTCDDHTVVPLIFHLVKGRIEGIQMLGRHMAGRMAGRLQKGQLHLQRAVGQQAGQLGLGDDLGGHQVQHQNPQRADVLVFSPFLMHYEHIFLAQDFIGGQGFGNNQRHGSLLRPFLMGTGHGAPCKNLRL